MQRWAGKIAVVTGASSGFGAAITSELLKHNVTVVGLARRVDRVEAMKKDLKPEQAKNLFSVKCDVTKVDEIAKSFEWIKKNFKTNHILVNNAGIMNGSTLMDGSYESWKNVIDVNVLGLCACTKEAIQLMKAAGVDDGHIVHINSIAGHSIPPMPAGVPVQINVYPATKYAITALTETLRQELNFAKLKTKITSISPGLAKTEIFEANKFELGSKLLEVMPHLLPKDIADAVIYALGTPPHVQVHELTIKPVNELF